MALSEKEADEIFKDLISADYSEDEALMVIRELDNTEGDILSMEGSLAQSGMSGSQAAALFAGPFVGGVAGSSLAAGKNILPNLSRLARKESTGRALGGLGRTLTQFLGEAGGIATGDVVGRAVAGVEQDPLRSLRLAAEGGVFGSAVRGLTQFGGVIGGLSESATQAAAQPARIGNVPVPFPGLGRVSRAGPHSNPERLSGISPESKLADRAAEASRRLRRNITTSRTEKLEILNAATKDGVRISIAPIKQALLGNLVPRGELVLSETAAVNKRIEGVIRALDEIAPDGTITPNQIDRIIRQQLRPKAFKASGDVVNNKFGQALADAESAATETLSNHLPGNLAAKNLQITKELDEMELAERLFGDVDKSATVNRITNAMQPGNESSLRALNVLKRHDPSLVKDVDFVAVQREFAGDIRAIPSGQAGFFGKVIGKPVELFTRGLAPFQRFGGGTLAGSREAFPFVQQQTGPAIEAFKQQLDRARRRGEPLQAETVGDLPEGVR